MPLISIITPVKNAAEWLADCIRSVQSQDCTDWEWNLIDDHSLDASPDILKQAAASDTRIRYFKNNGNGILPALKQALALCTGDFLTRMDADDLMPQGRLSKMARRLSDSPPKTVVTGLVSYISDEPVSEGYRKYEDWLNANLLSYNPWDAIYRECVVASPNWLVRTAELRSLGGFEHLQYPEDHDLCFRWYAHGFQIASIPEVTLLWREHPKRTSRTSDHYSQKAFFRLKIRRFMELDQLSTKTLCLWGTGRKARIAQKLLDETGALYVSMMLDEAEKDQSKNYHSYTQVEKIRDVQILIAIFPPARVQQKIKRYLEQQGLKEGTDYWYL